MCRWIAYVGEDVYPYDLLFQTRNSLISQSLHAKESISTTNGDGFGFGWYGNKQNPGVYRDILPAWNDSNLRTLTQHISTNLFFTHVRSSTGTATTRLNCHPFAHGRHMFMHNGKIGGYNVVRRELEFILSPDLFIHREGSTDSELFFLLTLHFGLQENAHKAFARTVDTVLRVMEKNAVDEPFRMTSALTDGANLKIIRFSSDSRSPSLYWYQGGAIKVENNDVVFDEGHGNIIVLSEPLDGHKDSWHQIEENSLIEIHDRRLNASQLL